MELDKSTNDLNQQKKRHNEFFDRRKLQLTISTLYKKNFNKIESNSIKQLEFQSFHHIATKDGPYLTKGVKPKDKTMEYLKKNHISLKQGIHICDLPKSPWGSHSPYNREKEFSTNHFKESTEDEARLHAYSKKLRLYKKIVNKAKNKDISKTIVYSPELNIYKTPSGNMYCKKDITTSNMYDRINNKYRRIREFSFENSEDLNNIMSKYNIRNNDRAKSREVTDRLYTPVQKPKKSTYITEKYKELWD